LSAFGFCNINEYVLSSVPLSRKWCKSQTLSICQNINNTKTSLYKPFQELVILSPETFGVQCKVTALQ